MLYQSAVCAKLNIIVSARILMGNFIRLTVRKDMKIMNKMLLTDGIFSDGMVLQRNRETKVWGSCAEGAQVKASLNGEPCAVECSGGRFTVIMPPQPASTDNKIVISSGDEEIAINDVCFGDVFLLSGQSNMQLEVERCMDVSGDAVRAADYPLIRHFVVEPRYFYGSQAKEIHPNPWKKAVYPDVLGFSAAGFFFARRLQAEINVPIGLVLSAMGGSTVEAWLPEETVAEFGIETESIKGFYDHDAFEQKIASDEKAKEDWLNALKVGSEAEIAAAIPENTQPYNVPGMSYDSALKGYTGSLWFYREVTLTEEPSGEGFLYVGELIDSDRTYINGQFVGETFYRYPPRKYNVPAGILRKGKNIIAVRLVFDNGVGGFIKDHSYYLESGSERVELAGEWRVAAETAAEPAPAVLFPPVLHTGLYNASLYPLKGLEFNGMLWYQGESNAGAPERYSEKFTTMMNIWRSWLGQKLPVVCTELCDYTDPAAPETDQSGWKEIQRQQREQPQHTADCAVALAADLGESFELHPQRKEELGERMAEQMLRLVYGK